jgi:hypothetical protein
MRTRWTLREQLVRVAAHLLSLPLYFYFYSYELRIPEPLLFIPTALTLQAVDTILRWCRRKRIEKSFRYSETALWRSR